MHIAPFDNENKPIVDVDDALVPLNYFNIVKLKAGEQFRYAVPGYETCIVPATGTIDVTDDATLGRRHLGGAGRRRFDRNSALAPSR